MAEAQTRGIGWMAWSYSGNSEPYLDQTVAFDPAQLTTWGQRVFTGPNGVSETSRCATVFSGCGHGGTVPAAPGGLAVTGTTSSSVSLSWTGSSAATQYQVQRAAGACAANSTFSQVGSTAASTFTNTGLAANTSYCYRVTASNAAGTSAPSAHGDGHDRRTGDPGGGCSVGSTVQSRWDSGYVVQPVKVTNTRTSAITGWQVTFTLPPGHAIAGSWSASLSGTTGTITATSLSYNGTWPPARTPASASRSPNPAGTLRARAGSPARPPDRCFIVLVTTNAPCRDRQGAFC